MSHTLLKQIHMPAVSIIIPTYNRAHLIGQSLDSVFSQTFQDFEIIVVDDGSTDHTEKVLARYKDRIRYIKQDNAGVSAARNRGILASTGDFIGFLDSDDLWMPTKLAKQVALLRERPDIHLCYTDLYQAREPTEKPCKTLFDLVAFRGNTLLTTLLMQSPILIPSVIFRREILTSVGLFDTALISAEDFDFLLRIAAKYKCAYIDECLVFVREHAQRSLRAADYRMCYSKMKADNIQLARWKGILPAEDYLELQQHASRSMEGFAWRLRKDGRIREAGKMFMKAAGVGKGHRILYGRGLLLYLCPWVARIKDLLRS